ncbi:hypothetical protein [Winogradskyella sp. 3972H.M.0a.05]|uniref:hypothetical protein n=1 Tax=Winogradskyella sp. 3972H.M.0a.05 TaxID=2950277 RepID=UPI0033922462
MKEVKLKIFLSYFFIISHFIIIGYLIKLRYINDEWISSEDFQAAMSTIVPVLAMITTAIISYVIKNKNKSLKHSKNINSQYLVISTIIPIIFLVSVFYLIHRQTITPVENFIGLLGVIESLFGVYLGFIIKSLYED